MGRARLIATAAAAIPLLAATVLMVTRVDDTARFVTWPVAGFTALAAATAVVGVWVGAPHAGYVLAGLVPAAVVAYVLPGAPLWFMAVVLVALGAGTVLVGPQVSGLAVGVGGLMVLLVVLQGPAVQCGDRSVAISEPWWIGSGSGVGSGASAPFGGRMDGTTTVGGKAYAYACEDGELTFFEPLTESS